MNKISFVNHPSLKFVSKSFELTNSNSIESTINVRKEQAVLISNSLKNKMDFRNDIDYCTNTLLDKVFDNHDSFVKGGVINEFYDYNRVCKGVLIYNNFCIFYHIEGTKEGLVNIPFFMIIEKNELIILRKNEYAFYNSSIAESDELLFTKYIASYLVFKNYASIENKVITSSLKHKKTKYNRNNKLPFSINYMDITWYTNLIRSKGFSVSGHWRLQPYSDGSKKLIWIKDFKKKGYTKTAKKLNYEN